MTGVRIVFGTLNTFVKRRMQGESEEYHDGVCHKHSKEDRINEDLVCLKEHRSRGKTWIVNAPIMLAATASPGDAVAASMIGALTIQGLTPGPMLFKTNKVLVYTIFLGMFVANTIMVLLGFSCIRLFTKVLSVPKTILTPVIFILCVVGSYAMRSNFYDVGTMLIAGVIGWLMGKVKIPTSPAILGLILGPMAEKNFRTALLKSSGNPVVFFNTPICWFFLALIAFTLFGAIRGQLKKKTN